MRYHVADVQTAVGQNVWHVRPGKTVTHKQDRHDDNRPTDNAAGAFNDHQYPQGTDKHVGRCDLARTQHQLPVIYHNIHRQRCADDRENKVKRVHAGL